MVSIFIGPPPLVILLEDLDDDDFSEGDDLLIELLWTAAVLAPAALRVRCFGSRDEARSLRRDGLSLMQRL